MCGGGGGGNNADKWMAVYRWNRCLHWHHERQEEEGEGVKEQRENKE